jgi:hypothetical protein
MKPLLILGFSKIGKSFLSLNLKSKLILDANSIEDLKPEQHYDIILLPVTEESLKLNDFFIVYPDKSLKLEYLERCSSEKEKQDLDKNWDSLIDLIESTDFKKIKLYDNEFLIDIIKE